MIPSPLSPEAGSEFWYPVPLHFPTSPSLWGSCNLASPPPTRLLPPSLPPSPFPGLVSLTRPPAQNKLACPAAEARLVPGQQTSSGPCSALAGCAAPPPFSRPRWRRRRRADGGGGWISQLRRRRWGPRSPSAGTWTFPRRWRWRRRRRQGRRGRRGRRRRSVGPRCACCRVMKEQRRTPGG